MLLLIILGIGATAKVPIQTYPDSPQPTYTVRASAPGMTADLAEEKVRKALEEAIRELGNIDKITTRSQFGSVQVTVKTKEYIGSDYAEKLQEKMVEVAKHLPGGASVQVERAKVGDREIAYFLLHGTDLQTLSDLATYTVSEKLSTIAGVSRVELAENGLENKVELLFRPSMMQLYGVTPGDVIRQLQGNSGMSVLGAVGEDKSKTSIQWMNQASSPQELGKTLISTEKGYVTLKLLADIRDLRGSRGKEISLYNGEPFIGVHVYADQVGQINSIRADVLAAIDSINKQGKGTYKLDEYANHNATMTHA
ncbi:efflux RND transporter permease subunit, partial [Frankia sp. Cpl3]|nr:efflux RND transporter permease subunit [Frankia sp. Cpl3]